MQFRLSSESFRQRYVLCILRTFISTLIYYILFGSDSFENPLCIIYYMPFHVYYMLYMLQYESFSSLKISNPILYYMLYGLSLYLICHITYNAILIRVRKFQTPIMYDILYALLYILYAIYVTMQFLFGSESFRPPLRIVYYIKFNIYYMLFMLLCDSYSDLKASYPIMYYISYEISYKLYGVYDTMQFLFGSESFKPHYVLYIIFTVQCNSYSGLKDSNPIMYYILYEPPYILYAIYVTRQVLFGSGIFKPHHVIHII